MSRSSMVKRVTSSVEGHHFYSDRSLHWVFTRTKQKRGKGHRWNLLSKSKTVWDPIPILLKLDGCLNSIDLPRGLFVLSLIMDDNLSVAKVFD